MEEAISTRQTVICEEVFDDSSQASFAEIRDYAAKIGIDPDSEPQLLPLAAEGLMKPLPAGWKPCYDDKKKAYYYHNPIIGKTQWEHPLDNIYRGLVMKARTESQSLSVGEPTEDATYTRDDLPSYEEPPPLPHYSFPRRDVRLSPLKTKPKLGDIDIKLHKQKSEDRPPTANRKMSISLFTSFDEKLNDDQHNKDKGLPITGGGSMFLKSNTKKNNDLLPLSPAQNKPENSNNLRSILRENSKSADTDKLSADKEDDDRKIVRFNVESGSNVSSEESENEDLKMTNGKDEIVKLIIPNSRFTVTPAEEKSQTVTNLKLIKPDLTKDIVLNRDILLSSDSEDISVEKVYIEKSKQNQLQKNERKETKTIEVINKEDVDFETFQDDLLNQQKLERDNILINEKLKHESIIKEQLESLRTEMNHRLNCTLKEEKTKLELLMEEERSKLKKQFEDDAEEWEVNLKKQLETQKLELEEKYNEKIFLMERELNEKLEKNKDELIVSHNAILDQMKQNQRAIINNLQRDFKAEEEIIRKEHQKQIIDLKNKVTREIDLEKNRSKDVEEERLYEKVRCEKRLLEDKYRCLKDKYLKLKTEVKLSIEKRNRKREQNVTTTTTTTTTTGSETERSPSGKRERTPTHSPSPNRKHSPKHTRTTLDLSKHKSKMRQIVLQDHDTSASDHSYKIDGKIRRNDSREYDSSDIDVNPGRNRKKIFSRIKSSSASRINHNPKFRDNQQRSCSPVENLRKQLQKLEDLEDQFPQNAQADTYHLRYPFSDGQKFEGSSELEFFRHRIHLERDSIRRAKESLKKQKSKFKERQDELKLKYGPTARHTLQQLYQEEKELTDMEVSLHRTRSLLGEKVIRLRHLEQSLQRATVSNEQNKQDDATLSDLSSHSASSGISSTEFATADSPALRATQFKESSEIIQSLENLNSEIREIWDVLNKQQQASSIATVLPPLPLLYPDLGWPLLTGAAPVPPSIPTLADRLQNYRQHIALANAQSTVVTHDTQGATTMLVEKTRNLRQWLRQTTIDNTADTTTPQTTL